MVKNYLYNKRINLNSVLFSLYLFFSIDLSLFLVGYDPYNRAGKLAFMLLSVGLLLLLIITGPAILGLIHRSSFQLFTEKRQMKEGSDVKLYLLFLTISFFVLLFWYLSFYPGGYSPDSLEQLEQAVTNQYNDWHPVLHTLIAFKIPLLLTGGWLGAPALFQIVFFSICLAWLCETMAQYSSVKTGAVALAWILLNPVTGNLSLFLWKDVTFAIFGMILFTLCIHLVMTNGAWMNASWRQVVFGIVAAVSVILRHNAVLFVAPVMIGCICIARRKARIVIILTFTACFLLIKGPLYSMLNVEKPDRRVVETMGLPLTVISNVVKEHPERLTKDTRDFLYDVAPKESWQEDYVCGSFNTIKWAGRIDLDKLDKAGTGRILSIVWECLRTSPGEAIRALFSLIRYTTAVLDDQSAWVPVVYCGIENRVSFHGLPVLKAVLSDYMNLIYTSWLKILFCFIGGVNIALLAFSLGRFSILHLSDWKYLMISLSGFIYNVGTTLLLSGNDQRFFLISFTTFLPAIWICCVMGNRKV